MKLRGVGKRAEGGCSFGRLGATFPPAGSSVTSKPTGVWRPRRAGTSSGASRSARHAEPEGVTANGPSPRGWALLPGVSRQGSAGLLSDAKVFDHTRLKMHHLLPSSHEGYSPLK